jgi:hypothetical protein
MLDVHTSLRKELKEVHEALSRCQHENQNLNVTIEELNKRSSLEQIHSAASSLKEQLGKASKEKDLIKEQLNKVIKEKEQLVSVSNERDNVIFSLKEKIAKLEKDKEESCSSFKTQLQNMEDNALVLSQIQDQLVRVVKERDNMKEELITLQGKLESSTKKMSIVENDQTKKTNLWQKECANLKEKCKNIEIELQNTKKALSMTKKLMQNNTEEAIKEKNNFELVANKEIEDAHAQASKWRDEFLQTKISLTETINIASQEKDSVLLEKNIIVQELTKCKEKAFLLQKENENLINSVGEKDNLILEKLSLVNEQDHLLSMVANLKIENETMAKKFEQDLHVEMSSNKTLLAAAIKEKEELITSKENLQKTVDDLCVTTKFLNEQLKILSGEKDHLVHAKENVIVEHNEFLEKILCFNKNDEIGSEIVDFKSKGQLNGGLEVCKNTLKTNSIHNDKYVGFIGEDTKQTQESEMRIQHNALIDKNYILLQEKECLIEERNKLMGELSLLKKINDFKHVKKGKRQWNSKGYKEEIAILSHEKEQLLASEAFLKQQLVDLEKKDTNNNSSLMYEKMSLLKERDNLITEINLLKKEKSGIEKKHETFLAQHNTSMDDFQNELIAIQHNLLSKQEEHANLMEQHIQLKEENVILIQTKDNLVKERNNLILEIELVKKENEDLERKLKNELIQLPLLKSNLSELFSEKDQLIASKLCLIEQLKMLKEKSTTQEQIQSKLEGEIVVFHQTIKTLTEKNNNLVKECEQHTQLKNEFSSLLTEREIMLKKGDSLSKEMAMLKSEKELLVEKCPTTLFEKDHVIASQLSQHVEIKTFNKTLLSLDKQIDDFSQKNEKLQLELQNIPIVEAKILKDKEQQTCTSTTFNKNEMGVLCNIEQYVNKVNGKFNEENEQEDVELSPSGIVFSNIELEFLKKQLDFLKQQQNETMMERDKLALSLKEKNEAYNVVISYKIEMETLKQKLDLINQQQIQLYQERDNLLQDNKSLQLQCSNLEAKISSLKIEGDFMNSSAESEVTKHEVLKERFQKPQIASLQTSVEALKEQQTNLTKENMEIALENEDLIKERDCLLASISSLKKKHEATCLQELKKKDTTIIEASFKKKFEELMQSVNALCQNQEGQALQKEVITEILQSPKKQHLGLVENAQRSNCNQISSSLNAENHLNKKNNHAMVLKEEELNKLQASLKVKLDDLAKITTSLIESFTISMEEKKQLTLEISSLKQECQKLHTTLITSEKDKDALIKKVMESRSTFDRFIGEINQFQRQLADVNMKLECTTIEKDNAKLQIADLQMLLSNQQSMQHLPISYSMEKVQTLEAQNRCLRMEKVT